METMEPDKSLSSKITIVTALFDLEKRENSGRKSARHYLNLATKILTIPQNMIIFAEPHLIEELKQKRPDALQSRTRFISLPLEAVPYYSLLKEITIARQRNPIAGTSPQKDTPLYAVVNWSKLFVMQLTLDFNPFGSDRFAWIDIGLGDQHNIGNFRYVEEDQVFQLMPGKIRVGILNYFSEVMVRAPDYYSKLRYISAAGWITGDIHSMNKLCQEFDVEVRSCLAQQVAPSEEMILPMLIVKHPQLFDWYVANYDSLLINYRALRDVRKLGNFLQCCYNNGSHAMACKAAERVIIDHVSEKLKCDPGELESILSNYYIMCYYVDKDQAGRIAKYYVSQLTHPRFYAHFQSKEGLIRDNFRYVGISI